MSEAWIYIDESHVPHRVEGSAMPFWVAALVSEAPIRSDLIDTALGNLRAATAGVAENALDVATLKRGYFHGREDSGNGHSAICRAITESGLNANLTAAQWFFDRDPEGIEGARLHRLGVSLSSVGLFRDDYDCLHFVVARRAHSFEEAELQQWVRFVRDAQLNSAFEMPWLPARHPAIDAQLGAADHPGIQVCDFVLWALQRANPLKLNPSRKDPWVERLKLELWGQSASEGAPPGTILGKLGRGIRRTAAMAPGAINPRSVDALTGSERWQLVREMAADVHRAAAVVGADSRIMHLAAEISRAAALSELARALPKDPELITYALRELMTAFLLVCDTWPAFDRDSLPAWGRAAEKRALAADYLSKTGRLWLPRSFDLGSAATATAYANEGKAQAMLGDESDPIERQFEALLALAQHLLPVTVPGTGSQDEWLVAGPAFMARATRSLLALRALRPLGLECDAYSVLRSLYEHITRFAYIAANPPEHLPLWLKWDRTERIRADNDMNATTGEAVIDPAAREFFIAHQASIDGQLPGLRQQADAADEYWSERIAEVGGKSQRCGLAGLYRALYRHASAVTHATAYGLDTVIQPGAPGTFVIGPEREAVHSPYTLGQVVYMMGLLVYAQAFQLEGMQEVLDQIAAEFAGDNYPSPVADNDGPNG